MEKLEEIKKKRQGILKQIEQIEDNELKKILETRQHAFKIWVFTLISI
jgi:hypothetical protein